MQRSFFISPPLPPKEASGFISPCVQSFRRQVQLHRTIHAEFRCLRRATSSEDDGVPLLDNQECGVRRPRDPLVSNPPHPHAFAPVWSNSLPNEITCSQLPLVALQSRLLT